MDQVVFCASDERGNARFPILAAGSSPRVSNRREWMRAVPGFTLETAREVEPNPSRMELRFASGNEMLGAEVDWSGDDDNFMALGLGVPPLPLWAHGEPAAMPALLFLDAATRERIPCVWRIRCRIDHDQVIAGSFAGFSAPPLHPPAHGAQPRDPARPPTQFLDPIARTSYKGRASPTRDGAAMPGTDKRKQSLYFPEDMLNEIQAEANRQDRSLSWIVQQAWRIARGEIMRFPSVNDVLSGVAREDEREEKGS